MARTGLRAPVNIDDGRVLASSGAMLAEGNFEFEGEEAAGFLPAPSAMVAINPRGGLQRTQFALVPNARRDADGLWSADQPVHSVSLTRVFPPLEELLDFPSFGFTDEGVLSDRARFELTTEHSGFAWVALDTVFGVRDSLLGNAAAGSIEVRRDAEAFDFLIEAKVDRPKRLETLAPPFTVRVRARLSLATMALAGSPLWWRGGAEKWEAQPEHFEDRPGPLASALTLDRAGGTPFFKGTLELGPNVPEIYRGTWVDAHIFGRRLRLRPQKEPKRLPGGFCSGTNSGPELVLHNFGPETWKELLAHADEAELIQSGDGIGYSQRVTGRDVQDEGPHEQPITMMRARLRRTEEGLTVSLVGELGPIRQGKPIYEPLGPDFGVEFLVPTPLLFARGILIGDMFQERKRRLAGLEAP